MMADLAGRFNAQPPLPALDWVVHHDWCDHDKIVFRGVTVEPEPECELSLASWRHWSWMYGADRDGHLVVRAENGDHVFEITGLNQDHQRGLYLRLRWLSTGPSQDPPPAPTPEQWHEIKPPWKDAPAGCDRDWVRTVGSDFHDGLAPVLDGDPPIIATPTTN